MTAPPPSPPLLTAEQRVIVEAPLEPLLVVAGAGSGKTHTMAARAAWVSDPARGPAAVAPGEVLGLTFTRKAAGELADRLTRSAASPGRPDPRPPQVSTYHAFAGALVAEFGHHIGLEAGRTVVAEAAAFQIADAVVRDWRDPLDIDLALATVAARVRALAAECAEHALDVDQVAVALTDGIALFEAAAVEGRLSGQWSSAPLAALRTRLQLVPLVRAYASRKDSLGVVDYGDQVVMALALSANPAVVADLRARHRVVILDEYQDTSSAQSRLLAALFGAGHPVTAVGDPKQSIFGWRGAGAGTLRRFREQFRESGGGPPRVVYLSTSWRNDQRVLDVANALAAELPRDPGLGDIPALTSRDGADPGAVHVSWVPGARDEAAELTGWLASRRRPGRTQAVLCRTRSSFGLVAQRLEEAGIPVTVLGLGGLLDDPVVLDVVATLTAAHDPVAGPALLRLLTGPRWSLQAADLDVVARTARRLGADPDRAGIIEAVDHLATTATDPDDGLGSQGLSPDGLRRVRDLGLVLARVRDAARRLPLAEVVIAAANALRVETEAAVWAPDPRRPGRVLNRLVGVAADFTAVAGEGLGGFLAWLEAARDFERGLDTVDADPDPDAVQILTIHAAKGLEWDDVVVVDLAEGGFPSPPRGFHWLSGEGGVPWPVRGDTDGLPAWAPQGAEDAAEFKARFDGFVSTARDHRHDEERRLAYVAVTRARHNLLLVGAAWVRERATVREPSRFLREAAELPVAVRRSWAAPDIEPPARASVGVTWPRAVPTEVSRRLADGAHLVRSAMAAGYQSPPTGGGNGGDDPDAQWWGLVERLLAERDHDGRGLSVPHLSASQLVSLAADPAKAVADIVRPVPGPPRDRARKGSQFHEWIQRRLTTSALLDLDDLPGAADDGFLPDIDTEGMRARFDASPWANADVVDVEVPFDVRLETSRGLVSVRGRIDAVVRRPDGGLDVVDWKTGAEPHGAAARARSVQLAVYRLAAARLYETSTDRIGAAFWYASTGRTVRPVDLLRPDELAALIDQAYGVRLAGAPGAEAAVPPIVDATGAIENGARGAPAGESVVPADR